MELTPDEHAFLTKESAREEPLEVTKRDKDTIHLNDGTTASVTKGDYGWEVTDHAYPHEAGIADRVLDGLSRSEAVEDAPRVLENLRKNTAESLWEKAGIHDPDEVTKPEAAKPPIEEPKTPVEAPAPSVEETKPVEELKAPVEAPSAPPVAEAAPSVEPAAKEASPKKLTAKQAREEAEAQLVREKAAPMLEGLPIVPENPTLGDAIKASNFYHIQDVVPDIVRDNWTKRIEAAKNNPGVNVPKLVGDIHDAGLKAIMANAKAQVEGERAKAKTESRFIGVDARRAAAADELARNQKKAEETKAAAAQQAQLVQEAKEAQAAARQKDLAEREAIGPVDSDERQGNGDRPANVGARVEHDLAGKAPHEVAAWLVETAPDGFRKEVATKVAKLLKRLSDAGIKYDFGIEHLGDKVRAPTSRGNVYTEGGMANTYHIRIKGADVGGYSGANYETVLHEMIHAVTMGALAAGKYKAFEGMQVGQLRRDLTAVRNAVVEHFNERAKNPDQMTPIEKDLFNGQNSIKNIDEIVAWGLTNPRFQEYLNTIRYDAKTTLWGKFVDSVRKFLGMDVGSNSALAEVLRQSEKLLSLKGEELAPAYDERMNNKPRTPVQEGSAEQAEAVHEQDDKNSVGMEKALISAATAAHPGTNPLESAKGFAQGVGEAISSRDARRIVSNDVVRSWDVKATKFWMPILPTSAIFDWAAKTVPALHEVSKMVEKMFAERQTMKGYTDKIDKAIETFALKYGQKTLAMMQALARINQVDVTRHANLEAALKDDVVMRTYGEALAEPLITPNERKEFTAVVKQRAQELRETYQTWEALGQQEGGQKLYEIMRQYHKDSYELMRATLDENIKRLGLPDAVTKKLMDRIRLSMETSKEDKNRYNRVSAEEMPDEYSPFKRFGKNYLRVKGHEALPDGFYSRYDTVQELEHAKRAMADYLGTTVHEASRSGVFQEGYDADVFNQGTAANESSKLLKDFFSVVDDNVGTGKKLDEKAAADLKDQFYQLYLQSLPEQSIRKMFVHSKNVPGFSTDVRRVFASTADMYTNQITKMAYAPQIDSLLSGAREMLTNPLGEEGAPTSEEAAKANIFVDEAVKRVDDIMAPKKQGPIASFLNRAAFTMFLTSAATAATQFSGIPIRVFPKLWADHGIGPAVSMLAKYMNVFQSVGGWSKEDVLGNKSFKFPTVGDSGLMNNPLLKRAYQAGMDRAVYGTLLHQILGNRATPKEGFESAVHQGVSKTYGIMTAMFNTSEFVSREMSYMAAFELEHKKALKSGLKGEDAFQTAVDKAVESTKHSLGNYSQFEVPRGAKKNEITRAAFLFKMYAVNQTKFFVQNLWKATFQKGVTPAERFAAAKELTAVLAMGGLFHGMTGMPLYSLVTMAASAALKGASARNPNNPDDLMAYDTDYQFRHEFMPKYFGGTVSGLDGKQHSWADMLTTGVVPQLTNMNIGSRTSFDNMWFRAGKPGKDWGDTAANWVIANMASPSMAEGYLKGVQDISEGNVERGVEGVLPAFFKGSLTALRLASEGAETRGGDKVMGADEIGGLGLAGQALGFQPTNLALRQQQDIGITSQIKNMANERQKLLEAFNAVTVFPEHQDYEKAQAAAQKIVEFNQRYPYPQVQISQDTMAKSQRTYWMKHMMTVQGVATTRKNMGYVLPAIYDQEGQ